MNSSTTRARMHTRSWSMACSRRPTMASGKPATGTAWLGLTFGCAQCHTHKYDPISHKEYYQLYAFFNSMEEPKLTMATPEQEARMKELNAALAKVKKEPPPKKIAPAQIEKLLA